MSMRHLFLRRRKSEAKKVLTSEESQRQTLKIGEQIWNTFNLTHPKAHGITEQDAKRLHQFKHFVSSLSKQNKEALQSWLSCKINFLERNFSELTSATIEDWERKNKQIFSEHLEVVMMNKD